MQTKTSLRPFRKNWFMFSNWYIRKLDCLGWLLFNKNLICLWTRKVKKIHRQNLMLFLSLTRWGMCYICPKEDHRLVENLWPNAWHQDTEKKRNKLVINTVGEMKNAICLLTPPNLSLIFRHKLDRVCSGVLFTILAWTHWVAMPVTVSSMHLIT